ncbi:unnamed protein product [Dovyalis caffra]|uniref:Cytochrome P450 n=1 Tax=Dovyalis caffra TaxID=77055 RepID=A0AAV1RYD8_9ROSI|nr:unnamed protein product [Dovyalis caffra]
MTRLLSTSQLNQLAHIREQEVMKLMESLINISREGEVYDLKPLLTALTNNIVCRMGMSIRCSENADEAKEVIKDLADEVSELGGKLTVEKFDRKMERIIKEHEKKKDMKGNVEGQGSNDLMDILLEISRDSNAEMKSTTKEIKAFFLYYKDHGWHHTSSLGVVWALAEVINNPRIFKRLREEINSVVVSNRLVKESDIPHLPYLRAVVKERLRLHPPGPAVLLRQCIEDCNINGFDLKGKTRILINVYTIMRDPSKWTDPDEFIPERFMGNSPSQNQMQMKGLDFGYLPFGSGRRGCIGASLASMVAHATIRGLVQCFESGSRGW